MGLPFVSKAQTAFSQASFVGHVSSTCFNIFFPPTVATQLFGGRPLCDCGENLINLLSVTRSEELNQTYDIHIHRSKFRCWPFLSFRGRRKLPNILLALADKGIYHTQVSTRDNNLSRQLSSWSRAVMMYSFVLVYTVLLERNLQMVGDEERWEILCIRLKVKHSFSRCVLFYRK